MTKTISERIYELRKGQNLTQEQLGALLGISGQAVSKWEKACLIFYCYLNYARNGSVRKGQKWKTWIYAR